MLRQQMQGPSGGKRDVSKDTCLQCGKPGHWARNCPDKKKSDGRARSRPQPPRFPRPNSNGDANSTNWKKIGPKPGDPGELLYEGTF